MPQLSRRDRLVVGAATLAVLGVASAGSAAFQRVARAALRRPGGARPDLAQTSRYQETC